VAFLIFLSFFLPSSTVIYDRKLKNTRWQDVRSGTGSGRIAECSPKIFQRNSDENGAQREKTQQLEVFLSLLLSFSLPFFFPTFLSYVLLFFLTSFFLTSFLFFFLLSTSLFFVSKSFETAVYIKQSLPATDELTRGI